MRGWGTYDLTLVRLRQSAVEMLDRVRGPELAAMHGREGVERQHVLERPRPEVPSPWARFPGSAR